MSATQALVLELVLVVVMAVFSAAEAALRALRQPALATEPASDRPHERGNRALAAVVIADFFVTFAFAAVAAAYLAPGVAGVLRDWFGATAVSDVSGVFTVAAVSLAAIVFGVFLPRSVAARHPSHVLTALDWPIRVVAIFLAPVVALLFGATRVLARPFGATPESAALITAEELKALVETGEQQGILEEEERQMIHSIFEFGEKVAHEVMVPRTDIEGLEAGSSLREALDVVVRTGHSRLPVYQENLDNIIGILYVKDLFKQVARARFDVPLTDLLRAAYFVPETKRVSDLLREMQQQKRHLAIVVDEYGGTAGLVTIEDLLEEIVGEIRDELEVDEERIVAVSEHEAVMDARVSFDEVNELFEIGVEPSEDYDTLGGFVVHELGRVPRVGDTVRRGDVLMRVESMEGRRVHRVRVKRLEPASTP